MSKFFTITEGLENLGALRTGGQGSVYKGRRTGTIYTAIKMLPTPIHTESEDDKNYRNFQNEVAKLQKVNEQPNPNVVKVLSWGITESGSFPYIEMEYIEGPDLCELLQPPHEKIFMLKELIKLADQLAGALAHCHKVGVKHGDVKSNNVKYNINTGNYVLLDFGLAIMTEEQRRSSIRHAGAIEFMAPEQHEGQMLPQTDVYSFGVILYELLTGQVPFPLHGNGETGRNTVMLAHIEAEVPDALTKRHESMPTAWTADKQAQEKQVPAWLLQIVKKCLQKLPQHRYANGIELQEAIVNGSLSVIDSFPQQGALGNAVLQSEYDRLQAQVLQYQQADADQQKQLSALQSLAIETGGKFNEHKGVFERNKDVIYVPKRLFAGIAMVAASFMILFAYSFFKDKKLENTSANTTNIPAKIYHSPYIYIKPYNRSSTVKAHNLIVKDTVASEKKPVFASKNRYKRKRKKFLGIF